MFHVEGVTTRVVLDGVRDKFARGQIPRIEQVLNAQEVFESSSRIAQRFLKLEGDRWNMEIDPSEIVIRARGFMDCNEIQEGVSFYLAEIRSVLGHCHFWAREVYATAEWPMED